MKLGEYSHRTVTVEVEIEETTLVREMEVIVIENEKVRSAIEETPTVGLTAGKDSLRGRYEANGGEWVFLSVAYDEGMRLKINGKSAKLYEVYDGFTAFYLEEGINEIEIVFRPQGFAFGLAISLIGVGLCVAAIVFWIWKKRRLETPAFLDTVAYYGVLAVGGLVVVIIYIAPMILCAL